MHDGNRGERTETLAWPLPLIGILLAIGLAWGIGWSQAREEYKREQTPAAYAAAAKKDAQRACVGSNPSAVFECVNEKVETAYQTAHDEQDLSAQQRAASSALVAAMISFLTLAISIVGVWFVKRTLDATLEAVEDTGKATAAMLDANEIAKTNARRQMRPYVWPATVSFKLDESGEPQSYIETKNFGQTPAMNLRGWEHTWVECFPLHDDLPQAPDTLQMSSSIVGPGACLESFQPHGIPLGEHSVEAIKSGKAALYLYGLYTYVDIFGQEHVSRFIFFSSGKRAFERGRFSPYMSGNIIDWN